MTTNQPISKCCRAPLNVVNGSEGTNYWTCMKCGNPSDPYEESNTEEWENDWKKANILHMSQTDGTGILWVNSEDVKKFIQSLLTQEREKVIRDILKMKYMEPTSMLAWVDAEKIKAYAREKGINIE